MNKVIVNVGVRVARAGVYAARVQIVTTAGETVYDETLTYNRRTWPSVERAAWRVARNWCEENGYEVMQTERDDEGDGGLPIVRGAEAREIVQRWKETSKWTTPPMSAK